MKIQELDIVRLLDGREGVIVHIFPEPDLAYLIEFQDNEIETAEPEHIAKVIWEYKSETD